MSIQKVIEQYLTAVEKAFGKKARENTKLAYRKGVSFYLKRANQKHPTVVDMGTIQLMIKQMMRKAA